MLSSLQNFLPQVLQRDQQQQRVASPETSSDDEHEAQTPAEETGPKRRPTKGSNETFIIVRPPPSKSNHPLNLQVQLVPPSSKGDRSRRASTDEQGVLTRTASRGSQSGQSIYSSYSSAASVNSVGSTSSTATNRRMIIPLYNLQAHNVMTNVIVDAGTDAKIAKFYKRGLEIIGLAVLEPTEVHGQGGQPQVDNPNLALAPTLSHTSNTGRTPEASPAASRISLSSSGHASTAHSAEPLHGHTQTPSSDAKSGTKKLFGRFFKKKEPSGSSPAPSPMSTPTRRDRSPSGTQPAVNAANLTTPKAPSKRNSLLVPGTGGHSAAPSSSSAAPAGGEASVFLLPAVLGIQPVLSGPTYPPVGKSAAYTWVVRRWLKGAPESVFGNVFDSAIRGGGKDGKGAPGGQVELRFEWTRGTRKDRKRKTGDAEGKLSAAPSTTSLSAAAEASKVSEGKARRSRRSLDASQNIPTDSPTRADSRSMKSTDDGHSLSRHGHDTNEGDDDGEESDPEDSETPWTCTLVAHSLNSADVAGSEPVRAKVATLSPTPHHPKVVAALKIPFPLPDVDVDGAALRPRVITPAGVARPMLESHDSSGSGHGVGAGGQGAGGGAGQRRGREPGLVLTAEEIKDVVSATGMWLVCRESIGGVGRVNRKGDGWKIRG